MKAYTNGNIIVNDIKIGDIHYEFEYGIGIKSEVVSLPKRDEEGYWKWQNKKISTGEIINYGVHEKYREYAPKLYDHIAYDVKYWQ